MPRIARVTWLALAVLLAGSCGAEPDPAVRPDAPTFDVAAARATITQHNRRFTAAHVSGDVAAIDAFFLPYGAGATERGKYINVWKQVNGEWRIQANIWNADPSPATATPN